MCNSPIFSKVSEWITFMHESYIRNSLILRMILDDEDTEK